MQGDVVETGPVRPARLPLRGGVVTLDERGIHHPRTPRSRSFVFTPYAELLHLAASPRAIWLSARSSVYVLPRQMFLDEGAADELLRIVLARIEASPGGAAQLERMEALDDASRAEGPCRATWGLALACLAVFGLQLATGGLAEDAGFFGGALLRDGDWWRGVTTHFLHAFPLHLILNLVGVIAFGTLCERPLGTAGTLFVMGLAGAGASLASYLAGYPHVVGVSGVVCGLLGAVTWLELRRAQRLPAWWRVPRRALLWMLLLSVPVSMVVPVIAGASHLGGLLAGALGAALLDRGVPFGAGRPAPRWLRPAAAAVLVVTALGLVRGFAPLLDLDRYQAGRIEQLARLPGVTSIDLNNQAWLVAIDPDAGQPQLEAALHLAERAADETERGEPTILDTLAELQFLLGMKDLAVATIDEAIAMRPDESYYREQRRRFTGERPADDRPPAPGSPEAPEGGGAPEPEGITA